MPEHAPEPATTAPSGPTESAPSGSLMPAEWERHERTWMAFPPANDTFGPEGSASLTRARQAWAVVAGAIARYEPVVMVASPPDAALAREMLPEGIGVVVHDLDDAWMRDIGPTFVRDAAGRPAAVDWTFNGWGGQSWASWENDARIARLVAGRAEVPVLDSWLVNEGGGFHVDGEGTVLLTDTVQLDPGRNPGATREGVEAEIHARLGTTKAIWLPRGLTRDYEEFGTRGHVDIVASFAGPGKVLLHDQTDPGHPDHQVSRVILEVLEGATDARGRELEIVRVPAPTVTRTEEGFVDYSYINHYVANDAVVLCAFDDPHDAVAAGILKAAYPGRSVELVDAREIFANGGGIHCITQQQPAFASAQAPLREQQAR